jgi:hypothetical protein
MLLQRAAQQRRRIAPRWVARVNARSRLRRQRWRLGKRGLFASPSKTRLGKPVLLHARHQRFRIAAVARRLREEAGDVVLRAEQYQRCGGARIRRSGTSTCQAAAIRRRRSR